MASVTIDGIETRYEVYGSGPPLLMFSPGGFDATVEKWRTQSIYGQIQFLEHLPQRYTCICYDRRETGKSGGRVERVTWRHYAEQGRGLLAHLGHDRAHVMGGCMGVGVATAFATVFPEATRGMVLFWPVGGARYRISGQLRMAEHMGFVQANGLQAVVDVARESGKSFGADPRGGPWASVLRLDDAFASAYAAMPVERYRTIAAGFARTLIDRDTAPGAEPEDMLLLPHPALVIPGQDASHATSAARYLAECLPASDYWDVPVSGQTREDTNARVLDFLAKADVAA